MPRHEITPPNLKNNPSWDVVVTQTTPLLSFFNSQGGPKDCKYEIQLDTSKDFDSSDKIIYKDIKETSQFVTGQKVEKKDALKDSTQYFWRARAITSNGNSDWEVSRFFVNTQSDDHFMNLIRTPIKNITASAGYNVKNIIDHDDPGLITFWQSPPPGEKTNWVQFDLGTSKEVCRLWILSNFNEPDGWLKDFVLQSSSNGSTWKDITETRTKNNNTFRSIISFKPVKARYFRLFIKDFLGYAAQINEIILYSPGQPKVPQAPNQDYVLIIGNEHNGYTFTELAKKVESLFPKLKTLTIPYYEASLEMLHKLQKKPVAVILSGNNADYPNLPMFEHNGEFEIIRQTDIPMLGICAGHQFMAMAYGYTRARSMGWSDISAMEPKSRMTKIKILKKDPIFQGISDNFTAPEVHSWAVADSAQEFEVIAKSDYVQVQKSTRRFIYGIQFHAEINVDYNHGKPFIKNFLKIALKNKQLT